MANILVRLFGRMDSPTWTRRDDPFAQPEIAGMTPAELADLPMTHPMTMPISGAVPHAPAHGRGQTCALGAARAH